VKSLPSPLSATARALPWFVAGFGVLVSLSGFQLYLRATAAGGSASFVSVFGSNLVASLPWLPLAMVVLRLAERFRLDRPAGLVVHALAAPLVSLAFLSWLALFHLLVTGAPWTFRIYAAWLRADVGEFFTVGLLLYALVVAVSAVLDRAPAPELSPAQPGLPDPAPTIPRGADPCALPLAVRSFGRTRLVDPASIDWIQAEGSYVRLHAGGSSQLLRRPLSQLVERLSGAGFVRVHRSSMVNLACIAEIRPLDHGDALLVLKDGVELRVSRSYRAGLSIAGN
jgi:two-component system LytT family response regulator